MNKSTIDGLISYRGFILHEEKDNIGVYNYPYQCNSPTQCHCISNTLLPGEYLLEAWGAQGGTGTSPGGYGAYANGVLRTSKSKTIYICIGAEGTTSTAGVFNGGGGCWGSRGLSGGGATDFRLFPPSDIRSVESRFLIAGGGGGASSTAGYPNTPGGHAGLVGKDGADVGKGVTRAYGGTQNSGGQGGKGSGNAGSGSLGKGGKGFSVTDYGPGGGGGLYGGGGGGSEVPNLVSSGAGGSSYVSGHPDCILHYNYSINIISSKILGYPDYFLSPAGQKEQGHKGSGYARVTVLNNNCGVCKDENIIYKILAAMIITL